jgi:hypothetical protein
MSNLKNILNSVENANGKLATLGIVKKISREIKMLITEDGAPPKEENSFTLIFNKDRFQICLGLLEHMQITLNGKYDLNPKQAAILTGTIVAIKKSGRMLNDDYSEKKLLQYFNAYLGTHISYPFNKNTDTYTLSKEQAEIYLKRNAK